MASNFNPQFDFSTSPTLSEALMSDSFFTGVMGPVGGGKSFMNCVAPYVTATAIQQPHSDGIRYSRFAVIRNTFPELKTTTVKTWQDVWPEDIFGNITYGSPIEQRIKLPGIDCEIWFLALDKPKDVKKLLSMELTGAFFNEAREIPKPIISATGGRVGRYPGPQKGGCTKPFLRADTNAMDDSNWWYQDAVDNIAELSTGPAPWKFYTQPPAVLECAPISGNRFESIEAGFLGLTFEEHQIMRRHGKFWAVNPFAENLKNLIPQYYAQQIAGYTLDEIRCYLQGKYTFLTDGKPVIPEYVDREMSIEDTPRLKDVPLQMGFDIGGGTLQPACIIGQRSPMGMWIMHKEVIGNDIGVDRFSDEVLRVLQTEFAGMPVSTDNYGDPAGEKRDEIFETVVFEHMRRKGIHIRSAGTNDPKTRREALAMPMTRAIEGRPGFLLSQKGCPILRKGLQGGFHYRRIQVRGENRYEEKPYKNHFSHPCEAAEYLCLGGGEMRSLQGRAPNRTMKQTVVSSDFNVFGRGDD